MPAPRPLKITLSEQQRSLLEQIVRRHNSPQGLVQRAQVILSAAKNINNTQIAQQLQLARNTVRSWRQRWLAVADRLMTLEAEGISDKELAQLLVSSKRGCTTFRNSCHFHYRTSGTDCCSGL